MSEASLGRKVPSKTQAELNLQASIKALDNMPPVVSEKDATDISRKKRKISQQFSPETHWEDDGEVKSNIPEGLKGKAFDSQTLSNMDRKQE